MTQLRLEEFLKKKQSQSLINPATASVPGIENVRQDAQFNKDLEAAAMDAQGGGLVNPAQMQYPFGDVGNPNTPEPSLLDRASSGIDNFLGTVMRASTPKEELGYTPPTMGDVAASAGIRAPGGGIFMVNDMKPEESSQMPDGSTRTISASQSPREVIGDKTPTPDGMVTTNIDGGSVQTPNNLQVPTFSGMGLGPTNAQFLESQGIQRGSDEFNRTQSAVQTQPYTSGAGQASASREARLAARPSARPDFNTAISDRERRGTGEMSMEAATRLTGGDRQEARAMIERQRQGMGEFAQPERREDTRTPEQVENERLRNELLTKRIEAMGQPQATPFQKRVGEFSVMLQNDEITPEEYSEAVERAKRKSLGLPEPEKDEQSPLAGLLGGEGKSTDATGGQEAGSTPAASNIPEGAIQELKKNPSLADAFDQKYGAGAAAKILNQ